MKAVVHDEYGSPDVLRFEDLGEPTAGDGQVVVRVHATSVNPDHGLSPSTVSRRIAVSAYTLPRINRPPLNS